MRSVRTTFEVLDAVAANQPVGLSELARRLDLPKSTVHRSLATLADLGWIRSDGHERAKWLLGDRVRALGERVDDLGRLREATPEALARLNLETQETVHLTVPDGRTMRLIERRDSKHALRLVRPIGSRSPMHAASTGKAYLAYLPQAEVDTYLAQPLEEPTSRTIVDPTKIAAELAEVRRVGYATSVEELIDGIVSVAASVRPGAGRPIASISVSGAASRMTPDKRAAFGRLVSEAAEEVAERL